MISSEETQGFKWITASHLSKKREHFRYDNNTRNKQGGQSATTIRVNNYILFIKLKMKLALDNFHKNLKYNTCYDNAETS